MINCPNCNTLNEENSETCTNCGAPLGEAPIPSAGSTTAGVPPEYLGISEPSLQRLQPQPPQDVSRNAPAERHPPDKPTSGSTASTPSLRRDHNLAVILEILPGLFGLLGIGWIYSGNSTVGFALLIGYLVWNLIAITLVVFTAGVACLCILPINILALIVSVLLLNSYIRENNSSFAI